MYYGAAESENESESDYNCHNIVCSKNIRILITHSFLTSNKRSRNSDTTLKRMSRCSLVAAHYFAVVVCCAAFLSNFVFSYYYYFLHSECDFFHYIIVVVVDVIL